ncbi:MAG: hypothetical protein ABF296_02400, partial [Oceanococcaceae bacterium]
RQQFDEIRLDSAQLARLRAVEAAAETTPTPADAPARPDRRRLLAAAAGFATLTIGGGALWQMTRPANRVDDIFNDICANHLAAHPLSFQAHSINALAEAFMPLGFLVRDSAPLREINGEVIGGHFCKLLDQAAAEIRCRLADGLWATVVQTAYAVDVFGPLPDLAQGAAPITSTLRGLLCQVWRDRGMVFVTAQPA